MRPLWVTDPSFQLPAHSLELGEKRNSVPAPSKVPPVCFPPQFQFQLPGTRPCPKCPIGTYWVIGFRQWFLLILFSEYIFFS